MNATGIAKERNVYKRMRKNDKVRKDGESRVERVENGAMIVLGGRKGDRGSPVWTGVPYV